MRVSRIDASRDEQTWALGSAVIVRGVDALWMEDRALESARARDSWRESDLGRFDLRGRDFRGAYLAGVVLDGLDLSGSWLDRSVLLNASLEESRLDGVRARGADLRGIRAPGVCAEGADFSGALLDGADFSCARLDVSWFRGASVRGAAFGHASFWGVQGLGEGGGPAVGHDYQAGVTRHARESIRVVSRDTEFTVTDADKRILGRVRAPDWQTALFRMARSRGYRGLVPADLQRSST
jgi:uncharacterized protein YjbI with pentapeptide repeats